MGWLSNMSKMSILLSIHSTGSRVLLSQKWIERIVVEVYLLYVPNRSVSWLGWWDVWLELGDYVVSFPDVNQDNGGDTEASVVTITDVAQSLWPWGLVLYLSFTLFSCMFQCYWVFNFTVVGIPLTWELYVYEGILKESRSCSSVPYPGVSTGGVMSWRVMTFRRIHMFGKKWGTTLAVVDFVDCIQCRVFINDSCRRVDRLFPLPMRKASHHVNSLVNPVEE